MTDLTIESTPSLALKNIGISLSERIEIYLRDVLNFLSRLSPNEITSIILFGSHANESATPLSDVDLLVVISDKVNKEKFIQVKQNLQWLELKAGLTREHPKRMIKKLSTVLNRQTGMFVSSFICFHRDFVQNRFHKIFSVSRLFTKLLAPWKLVLWNVHLSGITIWGENLLKKTNLRRANQSQLAKSYIMNTIQLITSIFLGPFGQQTTKYAIEAIKWSLKSCYLYETGKTAPLERIVDFYINRVGADTFLGIKLIQMMILRNNYQEKPIFSISSILVIYLIHKAINVKRNKRK